MSFALPINPFPAGIANRAPSPDDLDDLERRQRIKRAASTGVDDLVDRGDNPPVRALPNDDGQARAALPGVIDPAARLYNPTAPGRATTNEDPQPSIARAAPVVDVAAGNDGVFRRAPVQPPPDTLSVPDRAGMRAAYTPPAESPIETAGRAMAPADFEPVERSESPATRRANPYADLTAKGPREIARDELAAHGPQPSHGWGRVGRVLLNLGMGNPVGAAVEGLAPGFAAKRRFLAHDLPQADRLAEQEQGLAGTRIRQAQEIGGLSGVNVLDPNLPPTEQAKVREAQLAGVQAQREYNRILGQQRVTQGQERIDESRRYHDMGDTYKQARLQQFQQGIDSGSHVLAKGADGNQYIVNKNDPGDAVLVADKDGKPIGSIDQMLEGGRNYRAAQAQAGANQRAANAQAGADRRATMHGGARMTHAQAATRAAKEMGAGADGMLDNPAWKDAYERNLEIARGTYKTNGVTDEALAQASAERRTAKDVKAGKRIPANKHPEFQMRVNKILSEGGQAGTAKQLTAADIQAYANANYGGDVSKAKARIAKDHPDWKLP